MEKKKGVGWDIFHSPKGPGDRRGCSWYHLEGEMASDLMQRRGFGIKWMSLQITHQ